MTTNLITDLRTRLGSIDAQIVALGKSTINDGFGGRFYWDNTSVAADDGLNVIQVTGVSTGRWRRMYGILNIKFGTTPPTPALGDVWGETTDNRVRMQKGEQTVDFLFSADNKSLAGDGVRILETNSFGDPTATKKVMDVDVSDADVIAAIEAAVYNDTNFFKAIITPAGGKTMYNGQRFQRVTNKYLYTAIADNVVMRQSGS